MRDSEPGLPNVSPLDLTKAQLRESKIHEMTLAGGDCIYIPSYWWYQLEVPSEARDEASKESKTP